MRIVIIYKRYLGYAEDAARAIVLAAEGYDKSEPVNIGAGFEISIKELVELIVKFTGFEGEILWDATKPDGQPGRMLDGSRAEKEFGFRAKVEVEEFGSGMPGWEEGQMKGIVFYIF